MGKAKKKQKANLALIEYVTYIFSDLQILRKLYISTVNVFLINKGSKLVSTICFRFLINYLNEMFRRCWFSIRFQKHPPCRKVIK